MSPNSIYSFTGDKVPCKFCGKPTRSTATKLCDGCWELKTRIQGDPERAFKIIEHLYPNIEIKDLND